MLLVLDISELEALVFDEVRAFVELDLIDERLLDTPVLPELDELLCAWLVELNLEEDREFELVGFLDVLLLPDEERRVEEDDV